MIYSLIKVIRACEYAAFSVIGTFLIIVHFLIMLCLNSTDKTRSKNKLFAIKLSLTVLAIDWFMINWLFSPMMLLGVVTYTIYFVATAILWRLYLWVVGCFKGVGWEIAAAAGYSARKIAKSRASRVQFEANLSHMVASNRNGVKNVNQRIQAGR